MHPQWFAAAAAAAVIATAAPHRACARPVVLELFTSQGCSSCPPADALLLGLARTRADLLPLAFHVTYWNNLGWRDPFSLDAATARQRGYAGTLAAEVYTPQLVVDGRAGVVGSDRDAVEAAIGDALAAAPADVAVSLRRDGAGVVVEIGEAADGGRGGRVIVVGFDAEHATSVGRGENSGRRLVEANVVRGVQPLGEWDGGAAAWRAAAPAGEQLAVLVQSADGAIIGAARASGHAG